MMSQSGPQRYISDNEAYDVLPTFAEELGVKRVLFLHGEKSLAAAAPYLPDLSKSFDVTDVPFGGECSYDEIDRIKAIAKENDVQMVIGLGGGKVLDTAKSATTGTHLYLVLMPTLASNCAPWSALSVHYKENGEHIDHQIYKETANLMLLNPKVILNSPINYFVAGIADTLAKFYESELIFDNLKPEEFTVALMMSRQNAINCKEVLLRDGLGAIEDMKNGELTHRWRNVAETIIVTAGTVGGWGDEYGRATGAHSVHDALTLYPQTGNLLHGEKVGYGILVLLMMEDKLDSFNELLPMFREMGVPTNFAELNLPDFSDEDIDALATEATTEEKMIHFMPMEVSAQLVKVAMLKMEVVAKQTA
jgi:uncharacterized oxidoreductase